MLLKGAVRFYKVRTLRVIIKVRTLTLLKVRTLTLLKVRTLTFLKVRTFMTLKVRTLRFFKVRTFSVLKVIVTSLNDTTLAKVTYGKYASRVPDEVAYGIYEWFRSQ